MQPGIRSRGSPRLRALGSRLGGMLECRIDIFTMFGLSTGDAHVVRRTPGGLVTDDMIRSARSRSGCSAPARSSWSGTNVGFWVSTTTNSPRRSRRTPGARPTWRAGGFDDVEENVRRFHASAEDEPVHSPPRRGVWLRLRPGHPAHRGRSEVTSEPRGAPRH